MIRKLETYFANVLLRNGVIKEEELEIYLYGLELFILKGLHIVTILILALIFNALLETILFLFAYASLRKYSGGYHASSKCKCYLITWLIVMVEILCLNILPSGLQEIISKIGMIFSFVIIFLLSPQGAENKPLDDVEKVHYRKKSIGVLIIAEIFSIYLSSKDITMGFAITISLLLQSMMLIISYLQNNKIKNNKLNLFRKKAI